MARPEQNYGIGIIPGEYIINTHYYSSREWTRLGQLRTNQVVEKEEPLTVKIELHKVNPYKILWIGEKKFYNKGQEETFVRFTIDKFGEQIGDFTYEEKLFVIPFEGIGGYSEPNGAVELSYPPHPSAQTGR